MYSTLGFWKKNCAHLPVWVMKRFTEEEPEADSELEAVCMDSRLRGRMWGRCPAGFTAACLKTGAAAGRSVLTLPWVFSKVISLAL